MVILTLPMLRNSIPSNRSCLLSLSKRSFTGSKGLKCSGLKMGMQTLNSFMHLPLLEISITRFCPFFVMMAPLLLINQTYVKLLAPIMNNYLLPSTVNLSRLLIKLDQRLRILIMLPSLRLFFLMNSKQQFLVRILTSLLVQMALIRHSITSYGIFVAMLFTLHVTSG